VDTAYETTEAHKGVEQRDGFQTERTINNDWSYFALVLDRLFFLVFLFIVAIVNAALFPRF
jgi:hypothetical protein